LPQIIFIILYKR